MEGLFWAKSFLSISRCPSLGVFFFLSWFPGLPFSPGITSPKLHPNLVFFNVTRFSPFAALLEVLMGAVACRMIMVETSIEGEEGKAGAEKVSSGDVMSSQAKPSQAKPCPALDECTPSLCRPAPSSLC